MIFSCVKSICYYRKIESNILDFFMLEFSITISIRMYDRMLSNFDQYNIDSITYRIDRLSIQPFPRPIIDIIPIRNIALTCRSTSTPTNRHNWHACSTISPIYEMQAPYIVRAACLFAYKWRNHFVGHVDTFCNRLWGANIQTYVHTHTHTRFDLLYAIIFEYTPLRFSRFSLPSLPLLS